MIKVMSDENRDLTKLTQDEKISFGEKLKVRRESLGLSVQETASRLHLSPRFITMLENEDLLHSSLPLIYLRGYLRSYTRLLNIPENELAPLLEKLDPTPPLTLAPLPVSSDSLSLSFPLENNSYFTRLASFFIALTLLTSATTWWYLHGNSATPTLAAVNSTVTLQTLEPNEPKMVEVAYNNTNNETPLHLNNMTLEAAATSSQSEQAKVPTSALSLAGKTPVNLVSAAAMTANLQTNTLDHSAKSGTHKEENDDDNADEPE